MIERIIEFLKPNVYTIFILGIVVLFMLAIGVLVRKPKFAIVPLVLSVVLVLGFIYTVYNRYKYNGWLEFALGSYLLVAFIVNLVFYIIMLLKIRKQYLIIKTAPAIHSSIMAYLDEKGKIFLYTNDLLDLFAVKKAKDLDNVINYVNVNGQEISFKGFVSSIGNEKEEDYDLEFVMPFNKTLEISLSKRKIISDGNLLGYVLLNKTTKSVETEEVKMTLFNPLNLVSEAIAVYESDSDKFVINKRMQTLLGIEELANIDDYINYDDRKQLEKRAKNEGEKSKIYYRVNTQNSYFWAVETIVIANGKMLKVIKGTDFENIIYDFRDYSKLIQEAKKLLNEKNNFALAVISMPELGEIKKKTGKAVSMVFATNFFAVLNNTIKDLQVFEIGYYKFAFFIKNEEVYNNILKGLHNDNSPLLQIQLSFNDLTFTVNNQLGLVEKKNLNNPNPELMINLALDALKLASNKNYRKDYSIYFSKKKELDVEFENVDLSDDFLDKILN